MKKSGSFASAAIPFLVASCSPIVVAAKQSAHPGITLDPKFRAELRCPYADKWLAKGPEQAARELGLDQHGRKLVEEQPVKGSCSYSNQWSGPMCMQFQGTGWTEVDMTARCAQESGTFSAAGCTENAAGWCTKLIADGKHEATAMVLSAMMADCSASKMACESFMSGTFLEAGECLPTSEETGENIFGGWPAAYAGSGEGQKCLIAPGAIGAAHQAGFSKGYSSSCPNTPAQESPYMWPMKWAADTESAAMAYGSDEVVYKSKGRTFYMLDKNWKRSDTTHREGVLRSIVTGGPCDDVVDAGEGTSGCSRNSTDGFMWSMLHKENLMYFVDWKEDADVQPGETDASKIANCTVLNMAVVGNIRPDWFLDKRGDDTDVQYLGDQHVYYADGAIPKLVKQWRKKDFASQYFVMSIMGNPPNKLEQNADAPIEDNIHWPLILNIPGEGFGDDSLQVYTNHKLLADEDEEIFRLIENYQAMGGVCANGRGGGPPDEDEEREHIPSNLEVDPLSWVSNEITFSPIWEVPTKEVTDAPVSISGKSVLEVSNRITVESCYDESTKAMDMSIHFHDVAPDADGLLPWMAVGYRSSDACAMLPADGGATPIVLVTQSSEGADPQAHKTQLLPGAKSMSQDIMSSMYASMNPLEDEEEYMNVSLETSAVAEDTVSLHFKQAVGDDKPEAMNMLFAIGMTSNLGFHTTRGCFQVEATPCRVEAAVNLGGKEEVAASNSDKSVLKVSNRVTVESCYDEAIESMHMSVHYHDVELTADGSLPWMSVGYRSSDVCSMTPPEGGTSPIVLVTHTNGSIQAHKTMLLPETKDMDRSAMSSMYSLMRPLGDEEDYMNVSLEAPMVSSTAVQAMARSSSTAMAEDTVSLHFTQAVGDKPEIMNMMYAIGLTSELGFHVERGCFQVQVTPCGGGASGSQGSMDSKEGITIYFGDEEKEMYAAAAKSSATTAGTMFALLTIVGTAAFGL